MNYEKLAEKYLNYEKISDEEFNFLIESIENKIINQEPIVGLDVKLLLDADFISWSDNQIIDTANHGWIKYLCPILIRDEWYGIELYYHDDRGWNTDIDTQVLKRIDKRKVEIERWEYI